MAIKTPKSNTLNEMNVFLDEVKSMLEIKGHHDNIVNLQGITYKTVQRMASDIEHGMATVEVSRCNQLLSF